VVAQRTGLSSHVLRAWERRYGVVAPTRTEGGQRLYSDADIERLSLLRTLTAAGGAISQLAHLPVVELSRMRFTEPSPGVGMEPAVNPGTWRTAALEAIHSMDGVGLRRELDRAVLALGVPRFLDLVVAPMLHEVGSRWHEGRMGIAQEHLATAVVRDVLGWVRESSGVRGTAPGLVVATPAGQLHEGGALLVAAAAAAEGWRVTYLGANLPGQEIGAAAVRAGARAVAVSVLHPEDDTDMADELAALRRALPEEVRLVVGGAAAPAYQGAIEAVGGELVADLGELRELLRRLGG
jgi:methanogenic corrinoid protein MtbC1